MKIKKSKPITFRTTEDIFDKLTAMAQRKEWTTSQMVDRIVCDYVNANYNEANQADQILEFITETKCSDFTALSVWAIQNNCAEEVTRGIEVWRALLDENAKAKV